MEYFNAEWFGDELMNEETYQRKKAEAKARQDEINRPLTRQERYELFKKHYIELQRLYYSGQIYFSQVRELKNIDKYNLEYHLLDKLVEIENTPYPYNRKQNEHLSMSADIYWEERYGIEGIELRKLRAEEYFTNNMKEMKIDMVSDFTTYLNRILNQKLQIYLENVNHWINYKKISDNEKRKIYLSQSRYYWYYHNVK